MTFDEKVREVGDGVAVVSGFAVFLQWMPAAVGIVTIIYTIWRIAEALDHRKRDGQWPFAPFGSPGNGKRNS
jgi:hypothetical protein